MTEPVLFTLLFIYNIHSKLMDDWSKGGIVMDSKLVIYEGFFFKNLGGMLKNVVEHQHMTTQFMPTFYHTIMYGKKVKLIDIPLTARHIGRSFFIFPKNHI